MHELSVASASCAVAVKHAAGRTVKVVIVRIGGMRQVVPDSLAFYWDVVTRDGVCDGSVLEQVLVATRLRCPSCAHEWQPEMPVFWCERCGSTAEVVAGDELEGESIEGEGAQGVA